MAKVIEEGADSPDAASESAALLCADCVEVANPGSRTPNPELESLNPVQGYLAHNKTHPPRTLQ
jgi:hypothetical protein